MFRFNLGELVNARPGGAASDGGGSAKGGSAKGGSAKSGCAKSGSAGGGESKSGSAGGGEPPEPRRKARPEPRREARPARPRERREARSDRAERLSVSEPGDAAAPVQVATSFQVAAPAEAARKRPRRQLVEGRWELLEQLGEGSFGTVYRCHDRVQDRFHAMKLEFEWSRLLTYEASIYKKLNAHRHRSVPRIHGFGHYGDKRFMVIDLLGDSLEAIVERRGALTPKDVLMVGMQAMQSIQFLHEQRFLHRDIKPDNFIMGLREKQSIVHIVDFGLAKMYMDPRTALHIRYRDDKSLTGTPRYASINNHLGRECSRRDDVESLAYVLVYLARGRLPWQGLQPRAPARDDRHAKNKLILKCKQKYSVEQLCRDLPPSIGGMLKRARLCTFTERPNYEAIILEMMRDMQALGHEVDWRFSWQG